MVVVDTSVWIDVFRDRSGARRSALAKALVAADTAFTRFHQLELLQGCRDEREWSLLSAYLDTQESSSCLRLHGHPPRASTLTYGGAG